MDKTKISHLNEKLTFIETDVEIAENIFILKVKTSNVNTAPNNLYKGESKQRVEDDFLHEIILVIIEDNELFVFSGCSHNGIINILNTVTEKFPELPIKAVIGGFHLIKIPYINNLNMKKADIQNLGNQLKAFDVQTFYSCHCTGIKGFNILKQSLNDQLQSFSTGEIMVI